MKKAAFITIFFLVLFSCKKEDEFPENPAWLDARIAQMEASDFYMGTIIYSYIWNDEYYYMISIPLSSCIMCEFYSYRGEKVEWTQDKINDFQKNGKKTGIVWQRWS
jgi:hypothetical protein